MHGTTRLARRWLLPVLAAAAALAALTVDVRPATAGSCGGEDVVEEEVQKFERFARRGGKEPELDDLCVSEAFAVPRLEKRMMKACELILARDRKHRSCLGWAAARGHRTYAGLDVWAELSPLAPVDPFDGHQNGAYAVGMYRALGDPRAVAPVREMWEQRKDDPRTKKRHTSHLWTVFRNNAIGLFEKLGGASERDFLVTQLPAAKDRAMKKRMQKAIAAIEKRLAKQP